MMKRYQEELEFNRRKVGYTAVVGGGGSVVVVVVGLGAMGGSSCSAACARSSRHFSRKSFNFSHIDAFHKVPTKRVANPPYVRENVKTHPMIEKHRIASSSQSGRY